MTAFDYGSALFPQHAALLAESAVTPDVARARGYRSVDTKAALASLRISKSRRAIPGLAIPIRDVNGAVAFHQYRPDRPVVDSKGESRKYETPFRARMVLDVPPHALDRIGDPTVPLWITEGSRKADAAVSAGLLLRRAARRVELAWHERARQQDLPHMLGFSRAQRPAGLHLLRL